MRPSTADRRGLQVWSRWRRRSWCRAGGGVLLAAAPRPGVLVLLRACTATSERATQLPLAFTIQHPANRLTTGGATVTRLATARLQRRFMAPWPLAQGHRRKSFCCVTTRRRNFGSIWWLGRRCGTLTAHAFGLGVLGFDRLVLAPPGLPSCRLPAPDQTQAFGILAVMLVPTPRLVFAPTAFAQADPRPRSSRAGTAAAVWIIMTVAHGSAISQGTARGERRNVLSGRISKPRSTGSCQSILPRMNQTGKEAP